MKTIQIFLGNLTMGFLIIANSLMAQEPSNTCLGITYDIPIGGCTGSHLTLDNVIEPTSPAISCLSGSFESEAWYSFTVPPGPDENIIVNGSCSKGTTDLIIQIISGTCASQTEIACANSFSEPFQTETALLFNLSPATYFIRYINVGSTTSMNVNICVGEIVVGIPEVINEDIFSISPNPLSSTAIISCGKEMRNATLLINDLLGKQIKKAHFSGCRFLLEKDDLKPGIYFVQLLDNDKSVLNRKLIIQ